MASSPTAARLTESHRLAQARLGTQTVRAILATWQLLDPADLDGTTERWIRAALPVIRSQRITSARLAANYLTAFRRLELGAGTFTPRLAETAPDVQLAASLTVTGPVAVKSAMRVQPITERAMQIGQSMAAGAAMRHVLNGGRQTVTDTVAADDAARGWARATSGSPCHFCQILASRGPVYKGSDTADFKPHDRCHCVPEPVYHADAAWPGRASDFRARWDEVTYGLSGQDAINAYRRSIAP